MILEPVQGESGVHVLGDDVLRAAREACDRHGAALIFDEVPCGLSRTGRLWAWQHSGVVPDALTAAEALANGLPIGALICGPKLADVLEPDHPEGAPAIVRRALLDHHLVLNATGPTTVRLLPPLTIGQTEADEALRRMGAALAG